MNVSKVLMPYSELELSESLYKRHALNVSYGTAKLRGIMIETFLHNTISHWYPD